MEEALNVINISGRVRDLEIHKSKTGIYITKFMLITPVSGNDVVVRVPKWFPIEFYTCFDPEIDEGDDVVVNGSIDSRMITNRNVYEFYISATSVNIKKAV